MANEHPRIPRVKCKQPKEQQNGTGHIVRKILELRPDTDANACNQAQRKQAWNHTQ